MLQLHVPFSMNQNKIHKQAKCCCHKYPLVIATTKFLSKQHAPVTSTLLQQPHKNAQASKMLLSQVPFCSSHTKMHKQAKCCSNMYPLVATATKFLILVFTSNNQNKINKQAQCCCHKYPLVAAKTKFTSKHKAAITSTLQ